MLAIVKLTLSDAAREESNENTERHNEFDVSEKQNGHEEDGIDADDDNFGNERKQNEEEIDQMQEPEIDGDQVKPYHNELEEPPVTESEENFVTIGKVDREKEEEREEENIDICDDCKLKQEEQQEEVLKNGETDNNTKSWDDEFAIGELMKEIVHKDALKTDKQQETSVLSGAFHQDEVVGTTSREDNRAFMCNTEREKVVQEYEESKNTEKIDLKAENSEPITGPVQQLRERGKVGWTVVRVRTGWKRKIRSEERKYVKMRISGGTRDRVNSNQRQPGEEAVGGHSWSDWPNCKRSVGRESRYRSLREKTKEGFYNEKYISAQCRMSSRRRLMMDVTRSRKINGIYNKFNCGLYFIEEQL